MKSESPPNGGIEFEGYGSRVKAQGRGALIVLGFLAMAGAILYDGWVNRQALTVQTELLTQVMANQKTFIDGYIGRASQDHLELKALCLRERFSGQLR